MKYQRFQPRRPSGGFFVGPFSSSSTMSHSQAASSSVSPSHGSSHSSCGPMSVMPAPLWLITVFRSTKVVTGHLLVVANVRLAVRQCETVPGLALQGGDPTQLVIPLGRG